MTTCPDAVCADTSYPPPWGIRTVTSPETELDWIWAPPSLRSRVTSPLTVLSLIRRRRLACTVRAPETELPLKSPSRPWHSISPLTVLASTSPTMSSRVSAPVTVLVLTLARAPLIRAPADTVLALMSVVAGTEMLILALRLPLSSPRDIREFQTLPSLSLTWLMVSVQPSQPTSRGGPDTSWTSSRAVGESSWVTMSPRPPIRESRSLPTVSFSFPMSSTFGPSICHSCAIVAPSPRGVGGRSARHAISRSDNSRYNALFRGRKTYRTGASGGPGQRPRSSHRSQPPCSTSHAIRA